MLPWDYCVLCGAIQTNFIFITQGVQTLTREDRDINEWLHFLRCVFLDCCEPSIQKLCPTHTREQKKRRKDYWLHS